MNALALIWVGIIAFGVIMYVILDGFDLGIGIISIFFRHSHDQDIMVSVILPVWDGNETWLVFGGAALYGAFPLAFSTILPAIYIPIMIMVIALLFRGVAFEFRLKADNKRFWEFCFFISSLVTALMQGLILGTFVQGFNLSPHSAVLPLHDWLNPFNVYCALALVAGYALLGANRLIDKTEGALQNRCFSLATWLQYIILIAAIIASAWSPYLHPDIYVRWFNPANMPYLAILPFLTLICFIAHVYALKKRLEILPFWSSIGIFILCYAGFIISSYPYLVPRQVTYLQAAANKSSLEFMLIGACIMLPVLLYYTYYSYRIFRGKVTEKLGY
ncbi:MAG: cytochrome d ubiquinol oxidase subunit II [Gammaproteobacteria bacterium]